MTEDDDTQAFQQLPPPTAPPPAGPPAEPPAEPPVGPPVGPPGRVMLDDVWPWLALLGILAVAGLLVWLFVFHNRHHASHVVPAVVGLQQQAAIRRLTGDGYDVKAIVGPAKRPRGVVASQEPGGGSRLPRGATVTLHVSSGQAPATVPATVTTTASTTQATTTAATTTTAAPNAQVPDVSNQDLASAEGQIEAAGFVSEADPVDGSGPAGAVQSQSPAAGAQAATGSVVTLDVGRGTSAQTVQVPDVVGRSAADARAALAQAKLTFKTSYRKGKAGVVLAETPTGAQPAWTQVVLTVGQ